MNNAFEIIGGKPLKGEIVPQGAKNEALQVLSAVLLTAKKVTISNIPDIKDVNKLIELLGDMGVKVHKLAADTYSFEAKNIDLNFFESDTFKTKADERSSARRLTITSCCSAGIKPHAD